jgi:Domain of unknown function (DUF4135)
VTHSVSAVLLETGRTLLHALNAAEWSRLMLALPARDRRRFRLRMRSGNLSDVDVVSLVELLCARPNIAAWAKVLHDLLHALEGYNYPYHRDLSLAQNLVLPVVLIQMPGILRASRLSLSPRVQAALQNCLCARLVFTARFAIQRSWQVFCAASALGSFDSPATDEMLLAIYFQNGVTTRTLSLLHHHPGLGRLWAVQLLLWSQFTKEFFRLFRQFPGRTHTPEKHEQSRIATINFDRSDWHRGNHAVVHVVLDDGSEWYYKPRPGETEAFLYSSLRFVSELVGIPFETPRLLLRKKYFWMESVSQQQCRDRREAATFYAKAGILLYLLCRFRGVDFHAGNLIARQTDPVLIDCETLFHPRVAGMPDLAFRATGFLPVKDCDHADEDRLSALGRILPGDHALICCGRRVPVSKFTHELLEGFSLLTQTPHRDRFDRWLVKALRKRPALSTRRLFRSTQEYVQILERSLRSDVLASGSARDSFLRGACASNTSPKRARAEAKMLEQADVPAFEGRRAAARRFTVARLQQEMRDLRIACENCGLA